jgi:hypothetical protein
MSCVPVDFLFIIILRYGLNLQKKTSGRLTKRIGFIRRKAAA